MSGRKWGIIVFGDGMKRIRRVLVTLAAIAAAAALCWLLARWRGLILYHDQVDPQGWEVFGVDVSSYQGKVDWSLLKRQGVDFAFLKATEGSSLTDPCFAENWAGAGEAGVLRGAYHFFSYDSPGESQARNFIAAVSAEDFSLPPVVDIEFYGAYLQEPKDRDEVLPILEELLSALEEHYGCKPILYVTERSYQLYVRGAYEDYPLWVSMPVLAPVWHSWSFWQYSHTGKLQGYDGTQGHIDLNVFRGSMAELEALCRPEQGAA